MLCLVQYWTDKYLFVNYYKTPPKYGLYLANKAKSIIEYSIILHLFMGVYMMSNPEIFPEDDEELNTSVKVLKGYASVFSDLVAVIIGIEDERFS